MRIEKKPVHIETYNKFGCSMRTFRFILFINDMGVPAPVIFYTIKLRTVPRY